MSPQGSIISSIFGSYREALNSSQERYIDLYTNRATNAVEFYNNFLKNLIISFNNFQESNLRRRIHREIESFFGRDDINFVAIDGSCGKDPFNDFMVFSSVAYGVHGTLSLQNDPPKIQYKRRSMDEDISFVAYVPVPFAEIEDVANPERLQDFVVTDRDKVDLSNIQNSLMQLAEVYLAYEIARSSTSPDRTRLILMDHSPSSIMASSDIGVDEIGLLGSQIGRRALDRGDAIVAYSHPFNRDLGLPSTKRFRLYNALIADVVKQKIKKGKVLRIGEFLQRHNISFEEWDKHYTRNKKAIGEIGIYNQSQGTFIPKFDYKNSWQGSVHLFEYICYELFKEKNQEALIYEVLDEDDPSKFRQRWMSPNDVKFLIAIGMRALIEECWKNRVMLLGIVKDSQSRYFTRNYYGIMRFLKVYENLDVKPLPWTDRIVLENIAYQVSEFDAPWSTIEFDSAFMTLHLGLPENSDEPKIMGVKGDVVNQERLFSRSLGQFFLHRKAKESIPLMGHVIFIDRLLDSYFDKDLCKNEAAKILDSELGIIQPFLHYDNQIDNMGQRISMYFLDTLTRNLFPEAIGYPDPLHKADWGAKTVGRRLAKIISESGIVFRSNPIAKAFRAIRDSAKK